METLADTGIARFGMTGWELVVRRLNWRPEAESVNPTGNCPETGNHLGFF